MVENAEAIMMIYNPKTRLYLFFDTNWIKNRLEIGNRKTSELIIYLPFQGSYAAV
jgi:hypothetical protein